MLPKIKWNVIEEGENASTILDIFYNKLHTKHTNVGEQF